MTLAQLTTRTHHIDVGGIPPYLSRLPQVHLVFGPHAKEEAVKDELNLDLLPRTLPAGTMIVEVQELAGRPLQWVVRFPWLNNRDVVMAISPNGKVRTVWVNDHNDHHKTLHRERYVQG